MRSFISKCPCDLHEQREEDEDEGVTRLVYISRGMVCDPFTEASVSTLAPSPRPYGLCSASCINAFCVLYELYIMTLHHCCNFDDNCGRRMFLQPH